MDILITHENCPDGTACAAVARLHNPSCKIIFSTYGKEIDHNILKNKDVMIVDYSFPREETMRMKEISRSLIVIDHHKSVEAELKGLDYCFFDMNRCGAMLLWNYLNPDKADAPIFLHYIQDRDIWLWKLPDSREFLQGLDMAEWGLKEWSEAITDPDPDKMDRLKKNGLIALSYKKIIIDDILKGVFRAELTYNNGERIVGMAVNSSILSSDIGQELATLPTNKSKIGIIFSLQKDIKWKYSLRSIGDVDTTIIAEYYGGGGHRNASGFDSDKFILKRVPSMTE